MSWWRWLAAGGIDVPTPVLVLLIVTGHGHGIVEGHHQREGRGDRPPYATSAELAASAIGAEPADAWPSERADAGVAPIPASVVVGPSRCAVRLVRGEIAWDGERCLGLCDNLH